MPAYVWVWGVCGFLDGIVTKVVYTEWHAVGLWGNRLCGGFLVALSAGCSLCGGVLVGVGGLFENCIVDASIFWSSL